MNLIESLKWNYSQRGYFKKGDGADQIRLGRIRKILINEEVSLIVLISINYRRINKHNTERGVVVYPKILRSLTQINQVTRTSLSNWYHLRNICTQLILFLPSLPPPFSVVLVSFYTRRSPQTLLGSLLVLRFNKFHYRFLVRIYLYSVFLDFCKSTGDFQSRL